jgi:hypothetical protein
VRSVVGKHVKRLATNHTSDHRPSSQQATFGGHARVRAARTLPDPHSLLDKVQGVDPSRGGSAGGEQAANTLQPGSTSRHATTANDEVGGMIAASPLVKQRPYLFSHGRSRWFEASHAHSLQDRAPVVPFLWASGLLANHR